VDRHRPLPALALAALLAAAVPAPGSAQIPALPDSVEQAIVGVLIDDTDGRPIPTAAVTLLRGPAELATVTTDDQGRFRMPVPLPGFYRLAADRIGYVPTESQMVEVETGVILTVEFRILPDAILMEPILVTARSDQGRSIFEDRRQEWGRGIYLTPAMVDSINPRLHPAEVFRGQEDVWLSWGTGRLDSGAWAMVPRIKTYRGDGCLQYMVDRVPVRPGPGWTAFPLDGLLPQDIVAVEIYRYVGEAPPELRRFATAGDMSMCGLVVLWTHAGW
jgi:hypothetical protein